MSQKLEKYVKIRSFLAGNIENILENLIARRESSKINSEDLFDFGPGEKPSSTINWQKNYPILRKYDILLLEKESLGLYVSGDPLEEYQNLLHWVREVAGRDDIFLILIEKAKKIFTKNGGMMFALEVSMSGQEVEGIIFPKNALRLSSKIEEKELYWVKGNILDKSKNKTKPQEGETEESVQEFVELPKLAIEELAFFEEGVMPLFANEEIKIANNRAQILNSQNWQNLKYNPNAFQTDIDITQNSQPTTEPELKILRIPNTVPKETLLVLKNQLSPTPKSNSIKVKLEIQDSSGQWRKVKGEYWLEIDKLPPELSSFLALIGK